MKRDTAGTLAFGAFVLMMAVFGATVIAGFVIEMKTGRPSAQASRFMFAAFGVLLLTALAAAILSMLSTRPD